MENLTLNSPSAARLPSYGNPPVNEVVCGMRFHPLDMFRIPHIGLLWDKFRQEYPNIQHASPIAGSKGEISVDDVTGLPLPRVWFINKPDDQLIQFQSDRFYFNWRRRQDVYPRYPYVISHFETIKDTVEDFFSELGLGNLKPTEYELSYINHIVKGREWDTIDDLPKIFSDFIWGRRLDRFLPSPENVAWQASFPLPEKNGVLAVNLKQAVRFEDKTPLFVFELTARGPSHSPGKNVIRGWFDLAHEWIVKGFTDLTTPVAQKEYWKREEGG